MQWIRTAGGKLVLLSPQERNVTRLVSQGASNKTIADDLGISISTVKQHVATLMQQLRLANRVQLATWAIRHPTALDGFAVDPTPPREAVPFDLAA